MALLVLQPRAIVYRRPSLSKPLAELITGDKVVLARPFQAMRITAAETPGVEIEMFPYWGPPPRVIVRRRSGNSVASSLVFLDDWHVDGDPVPDDVMRALQRNAALLNLTWAANHV
jgi:hypothetical protein